MECPLARAMPQYDDPAERASIKAANPADDIAERWLLEPFPNFPGLSVGQEREANLQSRYGHECKFRSHRGNQCYDLKMQVIVTRQRTIQRVILFLLDGAMVRTSS